MVKVIAIILVVFCHSVQGIYNMGLQEWNSISIQSKLFRTISFTIGRLGVPLFLLSTGKLILSKKIESAEDVKKFYKKNLLPLLVTTEIWIIIYNIFNAIINDASFDIKCLLLNILFLKNVNILNYWYMPMILGMYIALPFLALIVKKIDFKVIKIPMIIVFLSNFVMPNIMNIIKIIYNESYSVVLNLSFLGGVYGLYIVLGYYIGEGKFKNIKSFYLIILAVISFVLTCLYQIWIFYKETSYDLWYDFCGLFVIAICIFELISRMKIKLNDKFKRIFIYISNATLGIYFVHAIVRRILFKYFEFYNVINKQVSILLSFILIFGITMIIVIILSKIKFLRKKVFCIRN